MELIMVEDNVKYGRVVWFNFKRGFGFIQPDLGGADIFLYYSDLVMEGFKTVNKDQRVSYEVGMNIRGQPKAISVKIIHS